MFHFKIRCVWRQVAVIGPAINLMHWIYTHPGCQWQMKVHKFISRFPVKKCHHPGGDCFPRWGVDPIDAFKFLITGYLWWFSCDSGAKEATAFTSWQGLLEAAGLSHQISKEISLQMWGVVHVWTMSGYSVVFLSVWLVVLLRPGVDVCPRLQRH